MTMRSSIRLVRCCGALLSGAMLLAVNAGMLCGDGGIINPPDNPPDNTPPTAAVTSPTSDVFLEQGETTAVAFRGQDAEDNSTLDVYLDRDSNPSNGNEVNLVTGLAVSPGATPTTGQLTFDSTGVANATYRAYARIDDGLNDPVIVVSAAAIVVAPEGSRPRTEAPTVQLLEPVPNVGLSSQDTLTVAYSYTDPDSSVTVTLLLDKDRNPNNDDITNPGDPFDPDTNIIILPNAARESTDPTFGDDPPPPDDPDQPPSDPDSVQIRRNPRTLNQTTPGLEPPVKVYLFDVDLTQIPPRDGGLPYFIRATISDGENPAAHTYAPGSLTITSLAKDITDLGTVGSIVSGARFQGFSSGELLGTDFVRATDLDNDGVDDFMLVSRYGSPRNRFQTGAGYLFFGRNKTPFPPDTNDNGLPDVRDEDGTVVDFPEPPLFVFDPNFAGNVSPYDPRVVGRFGGKISVNSVGTLLAGSFYRGTTYLMPAPQGDDLPPPAQRDPTHPQLATAGLKSATRCNLTGFDTVGDDTQVRIPDFVFGLPFISHPLEYIDDDPCDQFLDYGDFLPNRIGDQQPDAGNAGSDDMSIDMDFPINMTLFIMVNGANDIANTFRQFVDAGIAGQFDPEGAVDDENFVHGAADTPDGCRVRGNWETGFSPEIEAMNEWGDHVAVIPSVDNDLDEDLLVSAPGTEQERGAFFLYLGQDITAEGFHGDEVLSLPSYSDTGDCDDTPARALVVQPGFVQITGAEIGDRLGRARPAGDFNQDGVGDVIAGAPGADRDGLSDNGIFYLFFTPAGGFGETDLADEDVPRLEVRGIHNGDRFGEMHDVVGDINGDSVSDVGFASQFYDDDNRGNPDAGFVGVIFGDRPITGEAGFLPEDVGTAALPGVRFFGATIGARAGSSVAGAGDFNRDGFGDLLIASPGEVRLSDDGLLRKGVAYLILGGTHLNNTAFNLSQVGSPQLPGLVFISPYVEGSVDEAGIETVAGLGDVDNDGFDDVIFGLPHADFVFPNSPNQRRRDAGEAILVYGSNLN